MRFAASIEVDLPADVVERAPTLWDRCRALFDAGIDLGTGRVRTRMEAAAFLHQARAALDLLGVDDARFLLADGALVFEDTRGRPHDLTDLMVAFADHVLIASDGCRELRLCVEHEEAGFDHAIEARFAVEHDAAEPAALVSVLGRVLDFAPRQAESAEDYRRRIAPLLADPRPLAGMQLQFGTFVSRLEQALAQTLPGATTRVLVRSLGIDGASMGDPPPSRRAAAAPVAPAPAGKDGGPRRVTETFAPPRNFSLPVSQRIGAAVSGPPAFAVRLKKIEDLRESLLDDVALAERESLDTLPTHVVHDLERLNRLIEEHNFAYPIERNLALDVATGALLQTGEPWRPMARVSIDDLRRETAARRRAPAKP